MWFAALGSYQNNPWFVSLMYRLLKNDKEVVDLLDLRRHPFKSKPPKFVRARSYHYHFTNATEAEKSGEAFSLYFLVYTSRPFVEPATICLSSNCIDHTLSPSPAFSAFMLGSSDSPRRSSMARLRSQTPILPQESPATSQCCSAGAS